MKKNITVMIIILFFFISCLYTSIVIFETIPHSQDEVAYLFQAKIIKSGHLYLSSLPNSLSRFFDHEFIINNGKLFGLYTIGHPLLLAIGYIINAPWLINPLFGAFSLFLFFLLVKQKYSYKIALLSGILFSVSPFYTLISGGFFSHTTALFFTLVFLTSMLGRRYLLMGLSLGAVFLIRPYNIFYLLLFYMLFITIKKEERENIKLNNLVIFLLTFGIISSVQLIVNRVLTGSFLIFSQHLYCPYNTVGFGLRGVEWGLEFTPYLANNNLLSNFLALKTYLFSWPNFSLIFFTLFAFFGKKRLFSSLLLLMFFLEIASYYLYFHPGTFLGPRYWFESAWVIFVLTAQGIIYCISKFSKLININQNKIYVLVLILILLFSIKKNIIFLPSFKGYNGMTKVKIPEVKKPAVVFIPGQEYWQAYGRYFINQSPNISENEIIFARDKAIHNVPKNLPELDNKLLIDYFPNRNYYLLNESEVKKIF